jgi:hypothetical protein
MKIRGRLSFLGAAQKSVDTVPGATRRPRLLAGPAFLFGGSGRAGYVYNYATPCIRGCRRDKAQNLLEEDRNPLTELS